MRPPALMRGPEQEAEVPALRRPGQARGIHQGGQADMLAPAHREQALLNEGAIEPLERHHVGHRAERHQIERVEQVRLGTQHMPEAALAQLAVDRDHRHEHEAAGRELIEAGEIVLPVRVDQSVGRRKLLVDLMMVDDHHVEAELAGFYERRDAGGAAIDGHQQTCAFLGKRLHGLGVRPVALENPVRDVDERVDASNSAGISPAQPPRSRRRRRSRRRSRSVRDARPRRRCARPPSACRSACRDPASAASRSDRGRPRRPRPRHCVRRGCGRAARTRHTAASSTARARSRARRAGRATRGRRPIAAPRRRACPLPSCRLCRQL